MMLSESDVCLSVAYTEPKSRTERPKKIKIGTQPTSHVTRTSLSRLKSQRSRSRGRFIHRRVGASGSCSGGRGKVLAVGNCSAAQGASATTEEERGGGISWRPPASSLFIFTTGVLRLFMDLMLVLHQCFCWYRQCAAYAYRSWN